MRIYRKPAFLISSIIFTSFFIAFALKVLATDFDYSHRSHGIAQNPFNWFAFSIDHKFHSFISSIFSDNDEGLPEVRLFIAEANERKLLSEIPHSTKLWQKAYLKSGETLKSVKVKHRGDNSLNWMFPKKSWSVKTKKSETISKTRTLNYIAPQEIDYIKNFASYKLAERMGVLTPSVRLVELFINEKSNGIYFEIEQLNEAFLRKNQIMPINLYKGEQYNIENFIGIHNNLFNNPSSWSKVAVFNKFENSDFSDMDYFLDLLSKAETDLDSSTQLFNLLGITEWSNFASYQILAQNFHNDEKHNMRLSIDPWSGRVSPIVHDADSRHGSKDQENKINFKNISFDESSNKVMLFLNKNSRFIDEKYKKLYQYVTENEVLKKESDYLCGDLFDSQLFYSNTRDTNMIALMYLQNNDSYFSRNSIKPSGQKLIREEVCESMLLLNKSIKDQLTSNPKNLWLKIDKGFSLVVKDEMPSSNLRINFQGPAPSYVALDVNYNNSIDPHDLIFYPDVNLNQVKVPYTFYANRIRAASSFKHIDMNSEIYTAPTKFNFISDDNFKIDSIFSENAFNSSKYIVPQEHSYGVMPSKFNLPIKNLNESEEVLTMSGIVNIHQNQFIDKPVIIEPGTIINLTDSASIIFRNKVTANGTIADPIIFKKLNNNPWGVIALQGKKTSNSSFNNIIIKGGSGAHLNNIIYTGMFSIHDSENVFLKNITMQNNHTYDDMLHIVYSENIFLENINLVESLFDAIDIDISSDIIMKNLNIMQPGNDGVDFMNSSGLITNSKINGSGDKAISAGENSNVLIYNSSISENNIGVAVKDGSEVTVENSSLKNYSFNFSAFSKNWQYGNQGGKINLLNSEIFGDLNTINLSDSSLLYFDNLSCIDNEKISEIELNDDSEFYHFDHAYETLPIKLMRSNINESKYLIECSN